jgi:hypothetical protein
MTDDTVRYWRKDGDGPWHEVTAPQYNAAKAAGRFQSEGSEQFPAGDSFSYSRGGKPTQQGRITRTADLAAAFGWDTGFMRDVA